MAKERTGFNLQGEYIQPAGERQLIKACREDGVNIASALTDFSKETLVFILRKHGFDPDSL